MRREEVGMNQILYIREVAKKLKCGSGKKREIKKQLQADIKAALLAGESFEEIEKRMGMPGVLASEFNEGFTEKDKKQAERERRIKRLLIAVAVVAAIIAIIYWASPKQKDLAESRIFSPEDIKAKTETVIKLIEEEDYEGLKEIADISMYQYLSAEKVLPAKRNVAMDWGAFVSYGNGYLFELTQMGRKYALAEMTVSYENVGVTFTVIFDQKERLIGMYMK